MPACLFVRADCVHKDMRLLMLEIWPGDISQACSDRCVPALVCKCARARCMHTHVPAGLGAPDLASRLAIFPQARSWRCLPFFVSVCVCVPAHSPSYASALPEQQHAHVPPPKGSAPHCLCGFTDFEVLLFRA